MKKMLLFFAFIMLTISCGTSSYVSGEINHKSDDINVGYGTISADKSTQSTAKIKNKKTSTYSNIYDMIQGRVPGVTVSGTTIRIRGESSINGSNEPLILVDNIPMDDISGITPEMVDSIEILKDAASASIYGIRGANGVILITLKKSIENK